MGLMKGKIDNHVIFVCWCNISCWSTENNTQRQLGYTIDATFWEVTEMFFIILYNIHLHIESIEYTLGQ